MALAVAPVIVGGTASAEIVPIDPDHPAIDHPLSGKDAPSSAEEPGGRGSGGTSVAAVAIVLGALGLLVAGAKLFGS